MLFYFIFQTVDNFEIAQKKKKRKKKERKHAQYWFEVQFPLKLQIKYWTNCTKKFASIILFTILTSDWMTDDIH